MAIYCSFPTDPFVTPLLWGKHDEDNVLRRTKTSFKSFFIYFIEKQKCKFPGLVHVVSLKLYIEENLTGSLLFYWDGASCCGEPTGRTSRTSANPRPNQQVMSAVSRVKKKSLSLHRVLLYTDLGSADSTPLMATPASSGLRRNLNLGLSQSDGSVRERRGFKVSQWRPLVAEQHINL